MTYNFYADKFSNPDLYKKSSNSFTTKERDLLALMNEAEELASKLKEETRNKEGFYDTIHPLASTVGELAWKIDQMLDRMQFSK